MLFRMRQLILIIVVGVSGFQRVGVRTFFNQVAYAAEGEGAWLADPITEEKSIYLNNHFLSRLRNQALQAIEQKAFFQRDDEDSVLLEPLFYDCCSDLISDVVDLHQGVSRRDSSGKLPIHFAIQAQSLRAVQALLKKGGFPLESENPNQPSPLSLAILKEDPLIVHEFLNHGADANYQDPFVDDQAPLYIALRPARNRLRSKEKSLSVLRTLLNHGAKRELGWKKWASVIEYSQAQFDSLLKQRKRFDRQNYPRHCPGFLILESSNGRDDDLNFKKILANEIDFYQAVLKELSINHQAQRRSSAFESLLQNQHTLISRSIIPMSLISEILDFDTSRDIGP